MEASRIESGLLRIELTPEDRLAHLQAELPRLEAVARAAAIPNTGPSAEASYWADRLISGITVALATEDDFAARLEALASRSLVLADEMNFRFLYNPQLHLFAI